MSAEAAGGDSQPGSIPLLLGAQTFSFLVRQSALQLVAQRSSHLKVITSLYPELH